MGQTIGEIDLGLNINKSLFTSQISGLAKSAQAPVMNAFKPIGKLIGSVLAVGAITNFTKECLELGSDLVEVQNVVDTTFKTMNASVNEFAENAMANFGLSETVAKQYMGTLGAMSNSMGFSEQAAYEMAAAVTGLTGDVASFYNLDTDEAFNKLKAIWTGETEALRTIGVLLTQTNLDQYALNNGFGRTTASMTEQEKVMLRYQYTMSALADASGDFAKTSGSWANQVRILSLQFDSLKATLGQGFINLFTPIIQMINAVIAKLQVLAQQFKLFTELLLGNRGETNVIAGITQNTSEAVSGLNGVTGAAKAAAKAVGLLSIDELNVLGSEDTGSGAGGIVSDMTSVNNAAGETTGALDEIDAKLQGLVDTSKKFLERIKDIFNDFKVGDFFKAGQDVSKLVADIFNFFSRAMESVPWRDIGYSIGKFLGGIDWQDVFTAVGNFLETAVDAAIDLWKGAFDANPIATSIVTALGVAHFTGLSGILKSKISNALPANLSLGKTILITGITVKFLFDASKDITESLAEWSNEKYGKRYDIEYIQNFKMTDIFTDPYAIEIQKPENWKPFDIWSNLLFGEAKFEDLLDKWIIDGLTNFFSKKQVEWEDFKEFGRNIVDSLVEGTKERTSTTSDVFAGILEWVKSGISDAFGIQGPATEMYPLGSNILLGVVEGFNGSTEEFSTTISNWFDTSVKPWFTLSHWQGIFGNIKTALSTKWTEIKTWWDGNALVKWWKDSVEPWFTKKQWGDSMTGIKDAFSEAFKNAFNAAGTQLNKFIDWINQHLHISWDSLSIAGQEIIPSADFQLFTLPNIPMLAQGGYVGADQPRLVMIGDNKHEGEIVSPESKLLDMAVQAAELAGGSGLNNELLMTIIELLTRIITILENLNLDIELDGRSLLQSLKDSQKRLGHQF